MYFCYLPALTGSLISGCSPSNVVKLCKLNLQAMVYFSDHGESLDKSHNPDTFDFVMTHIPFWVYLSPQYRTAYPQTADVLTKHEHQFSRMICYMIH